MDYEKQRQKRLDIRLDAWGRYRAAPDGALGYKARSAEATLRDDGRTRQVAVRAAKREAVFANADGGQDVIAVPAQEARCKETRDVKPRTSNYGGSSDSVLEVERAYHDMRNTQWQAALRIHYVQGLEGKRAAREFGMSVASFYSALKQARAFMMGRLGIG